MGTIRNDHGVTINEITVSHRALANSPHDAVVFNPRDGIRGVNIGGKVWAASDDTVIRSVNISFDGVSVECNTEFLMMLSDLDFRKEFVAKCKADRAAAEAAEMVPHVWEQRPEKDFANPGSRSWQCFKCQGWISVQLATEGAKELAAEMDAGKGPLGCRGIPPQPEAPPTDAEDRVTGNAAVDLKNAEKKAKSKAAKKAKPS